MPVESRDDLVGKWSCEERSRKNCRNPFGCHCREITSLVSARESDAKRIAELEAERDKLRAIISASATAIGNGAMLSPECSIEFMEGLPEEISKYTDKLRRFLKCSRDEGGEALKRANRIERELDTANANHRDMASRLKDMGTRLEAAERALAEETERCARIAETFSPIGKLKHRGTCLGIATAIRSGKHGKE